MHDLGCVVQIAGGASYSGGSLLCLPFFCAVPPVLPDGAVVASGCQPSASGGAECLWHCRDGYTASGSPNATVWGDACQISLPLFPSPTFATGYDRFPVLLHAQCAIADDGTARFIGNEDFTCTGLSLTLRIGILR